MGKKEIFVTQGVAQLARPTDQIGWTRRQVWEHSARTAVTAVVSMLAAGLFALPQSYWAPITTLVITQSSIRTTLSTSWQRFVGTLLGAAVGAIIATRFGAHLPMFGVSIAILGLVCSGVHADRSAYRIGGVTLAVVLLVPQTEPAWRVAFHRFAEVSIGIAVALVMTVVWPETEATKGAAIPRWARTPL